MRFETLVAGLPEPIFDLAFLRQRFAVSEAENASLAVQLSRWETKGKIIRLRRGLYALANSKSNALEMANRLVEPSYISGEFALSYYGLIQDATFEVTCACMNTPRRARLQHGKSRYSYRQVKVFDGFSSIAMGGKNVLFASPEKALVDTWHWSPGEWTRERHREMRYESRELVNGKRLMSWAEKFPRRVCEAARIYLELGHEG